MELVRGGSAIEGFGKYVLNVLVLRQQPPRKRCIS
jgi:hypothetical protein